MGLTIAIDASNIGVAGGATHLVEILRAVEPSRHGIEAIYIWGPEHLESHIEARSFLHFRSPSALNKSLLHRLWWQQLRLADVAAGCDVLFVPGGLYLGRFRPFVTMMRNMLPFAPRERARFGFTLNRLRYHLLEWGQQKTFDNAAGTIFLTQTARDAVVERHGSLDGGTTIILHGVSGRFATEDNLDQPPPASDEEDSPFRWLYVSPIKLYKHQWTVVRAVSALREEGYSVALDLVGGGEPRAMKKLRDALRKTNRDGKTIRYHGRVSHQKIDDFYRNSDAFVFASTCETFGQVLTEAMQAGLPIACSSRSVAPEVVQDSAVYFDPKNLSEMVEAMRTIMDNSELRKRKAQAGRNRVREFSWDRCARETFSFLTEVARRSETGSGCTEVQSEKKTF
jgi:glycosyltransferase involved in cell wall biosynthesis